MPYLIRGCKIIFLKTIGYMNGTVHKQGESRSGRGHALVFCHHDRIARAGDSFQPGAVGDHEAATHIGDQPGALEASQEEIHGGPPDAEYLGQELLREGKGLPSD